MSKPKKLTIAQAFKIGEYMELIVFDTAAYVMESAKIEPAKALEFTSQYANNKMTEMLLGYATGKSASDVATKFTAQILSEKGI